MDNEQVAVRKVKVVDTTNPEITLKGKSTEYVEAGFPWSDPMVGCTEGCAMDNIDGDISADIKTADVAVPTGWYTVTMKVGTEVQLKKVWCDMTDGGETYFALKNAAPIQPYHVGADGDCTTV